MLKDYLSPLPPQKKGFPIHSIVCSYLDETLTFMEKAANILAVSYKKQKMQKLGGHLSCSANCMVEEAKSHFFFTRGSYEQRCRAKSRFLGEATSPGSTAGILESLKASGLGFHTTRRFRAEGFATQLWRIKDHWRESKRLETWRDLLGIARSKL